MVDIYSFTTFAFSMTLKSDEREFVSMQNDPVKKLPWLEIGCLHSRIEKIAHENLYSGLSSISRKKNI